MRAIKILTALALLMCRSTFAGELYTNVTRSVLVPAEEATRLWISSFQPLTITTDHRDDLPRPCTPEIPKAVALQWNTNYGFFSEHLVSAAEQAHLDSPSLATILSTLRGSKENRGLAILPVQALSTWVDGMAVWVVNFRWEQAGLASDGYVGHVRSFTFTQKNLKLITWQTCD